MSDIFRLEVCARCGEKTPVPNLKEYGGELLCPKCHREELDKKKKTCPYCKNRFKDLKKHLKTCKMAPGNVTTAGGGASPFSPTASGGQALAEAPVIKRLQSELESAKSTIQGLEGELRALRGQVQLVTREIPAVLENSISTLGKAISSSLGGGFQKRRPEGERDGAPPTVPRTPPKGPTGMFHYPPRIWKASIFPLEARVSPPLLAQPPAYYLLQVLVKRDERARRHVRATISSNNAEKVRDLLDPRGTSPRYFRTRVNWKDVLVLALSESTSWFTSCHVFGVFVRMLGRTVEKSWEMLSGGDFEPPLGEDAIIKAFRQQVWHEFDAWGRLGFEVSWSDHRLGRVHELDLAEWFVVNQNKPAGLREIAEVLKKTEYASLERAARVNVQRAIRRFAGREGFLEAVDPTKPSHRDYVLGETLQCVSIHPKFWTGFQVGADSSEVVVVKGLRGLEDFAGRFF
ncbi:MAG: hypothetical protein ACTSU5_11710 [Promethearchaeota archaeon]